MRNLFRVIGSLLLLDGALFLIFSNFNLGAVWTLGLGAILVCYGQFRPQILRLCQKRAWNALRLTLFAFGGALLCVMVWIAGYGQLSDVDYHEDAVIVLGAAVHGDVPSLTLRQRLNKALEYYEKNPSCIIVTSGGQGPQESVTEASAMAQYLKERGVPSEQILEEGQSTSTRENFRFSKVLLDARFDRPYTTVCISNSFHLYRAVQTARSEGLRVRHLGAPIRPDTIPMNYLRETSAVLAHWVFGA